MSPVLDQHPSSNCARIRLDDIIAGLACGLFFSFAPIEVLFLGVIIWLPLLVWRERIRSLREGFFPGGIVRLVVMSSVVMIVWKGPPAFLDRKVKSFHASELSLAEVQRKLDEQGYHFYFPISIRERRIKLPDRPTSVREVIAEIQTQCAVEKPRISRCSNCSSIFTGPYYAVMFTEPRTNAVLPSP